MASRTTPFNGTNENAQVHDYNLRGATPSRTLPADQRLDYKGYRGCPRPSCTAAAVEMLNDAGRLFDRAAATCTTTSTSHAATMAERVHQLADDAVINGHVCHDDGSVHVDIDSDIGDYELPTTPTYTSSSPANIDIDYDVESSSYGFAYDADTSETDSVVDEGRVMTPTIDSFSDEEDEDVVPMDVADAGLAYVPAAVSPKVLRQRNWASQVFHTASPRKARNINRTAAFHYGSIEAFQAPLTAREIYRIQHGIGDRHDL